MTLNCIWWWGSSFGALGSVVLLYTRNEVAITFVYKNINSFYLQSKLVVCERERERDRRGNCYDLHYVEIDIFRTLFLWASFTEAWHWHLQPGSHLAFLWGNDQAAWLVYSADCSPRLIAWVENFPYIFFWYPHILPCSAPPTQFFPCNSHGISAVLFLPYDTAAHPVLKSILLSLSKVNM